MAEHDKTHCPECDSSSLFHRQVTGGGGYGPNFLPGLGGFLAFAKVDVVVCAGCGLTRLYAEPSARRKLPEAKGWSRGVPRSMSS